MTLSKPTDVKERLKGKKLIFLGEQLFMMGKEVSGNKQIKMPMVKQCKKCKNMMQQSQ